MITSPILSQNFPPTLRALASISLERSNVDGPQSLEPGSPSEIVDSFSPTAKSAKAATSALTRWAGESSSALAAALGPVALVSLTREAARLTLDPTLEAKAGEEALGELSTRPLEENSNLEAAWKHFQPQLSRRVEEPLLTDRDLIDMGAATGTQVVLNFPETVSSELATFITAHEVAHAELGHWQQAHALEYARRLAPLGAETARAFRQAERDMELEADRRAVELTSGLLADPAAILRELIHTKVGPSHPDGLTRALNAREAFAQQGLKVSEQTWSEMVEATQQRREKEERLEAQQAAVDWSRYQ